MKKILSLVFLLSPTVAFAHPGHEAAGLLAGLEHPLTGLDHIAVMVAVGLWSAINGGRALWMWPLAFVGTMIFGGVLGMTHTPIPLSEQAIAASLVVIGLLVALAVNLPVWLGGAIVAAFALFHGYAHGAELPEAANGALYLAGFAVTTAALHALGIAVALSAKAQHWQPVVRAAGAACALLGVVLAVQMV